MKHGAIRDDRRDATFNHNLAGDRSVNRPEQCDLVGALARGNREGTEAA